MQRPRRSGAIREEHGRHRRGPPPRGAAQPRARTTPSASSRAAGKADGSTDLLNWDVVIPGKKDTMFCAVLSFM